MNTLDLCMSLTFDLYVDGGGILSEIYSRFLSFFGLRFVIFSIAYMHDIRLGFKVL